MNKYYIFASKYVNARLDDIAVYEARQVDRLIKPKEDYVRLCNERALRAIEARAEEVCKDFIAEPWCEGEDFVQSEKGARDACMLFKFRIKSGDYDIFFESLWNRYHGLKDFRSSRRSDYQLITTNSGAIMGNMFKNERDYLKARKMAMHEAASALYVPFERRISLREFIKICHNRACRDILSLCQNEEEFSLADFDDAEERNDSRRAGYESVYMEVMSGAFDEFYICYYDAFFKK